ncbi:MAG TPA: ferric reductase-like transmembrane domain-containing protein [Acidimicrobiia bacterium]|nr:ferric reductase-like transmembrane domain-containing protein [Acidimicrobiia bacterium]
MNFPWYLARAAGLTSWALLVFATLWGLALSTKVLGKRPRPNWILDLHRWLGGLAVIFTGVHVGALLVDQYVHFGIQDVLVPFASSWHPGAVAWGVVAFYMLLAVELTSLARRRLPNKLWRGIHYLSFPLFLSATAHGLTAGTDATSLMLRVAIITALGVFAALLAARAAIAIVEGEADNVAAHARRDLVDARRVGRG